MPTTAVADCDRALPLAGLVGLFVLTVIVGARWHGLRALIGLAIRLLLLAGFLVPAILAGRNALAVAVTGAFGVMLVTLYLSHRVNLKTTTALIGTSAALVLTGVLGRGGGAALGVLDDVTVTQASAVFALYDAEPTQTWSDLFKRGMTVGRDHSVSTVNTLVLAYAGASITLLLLFSAGGRPVGEIVNSGLVAQEIVETLVGSMGLVAAVPLTTALAVTLALGQRPRSQARPRCR